MPERWLTVLLRITPSKSPGEDLAALAIDPVAIRSAKRAACPKGGDRSISSTWRWYLRAIAAVVLTARVVTPEPPLAEKKATTGAAGRDDRHTFGGAAQALEQTVPVEGEKDGVRKTVDVGHVPVLGPWSGQDHHVAWCRPARQKDLAGAVGDRFFNLAGGDEHHHVSALGVKSQCVSRRQVDRAHASCDSPKHAVPQLREYRRHLEDAGP